MTSVLERRSTEVDPRIAARRQEVAAAAGRRRQRRLWGSLGVIAIVAAAWGVTRTALLDIDEIQVRGADQTSEEEVRAAAGVPVGTQILDVDAPEVRERLRALPWVDDAAVRVAWPGTLEIQVRERVPVAAFQDASGAWLLMDASGRVLGPAREPGWPAVEGLVPAPVGGTVQGPVADAMAVVGALTPGLRSRVEAVVVTDGGAVELRLLPAGTALLGPATDVDRKIEAARTVLAQVDDTCLAVVDLRVSETAVVTRDAACEAPTPSATTGSGTGTGTGATSGG